METLRRFGMTELRPGQYVLVRFGPGSKGMMAAEIQPETGSPGLSSHSSRDLFTPPNKDRWPSRSLEDGLGDGGLVFATIIGLYGSSRAKSFRLSERCFMSSYRAVN